jgi:PKD repeat protein
MNDGTVTVEDGGTVPLAAQCNGPYSGMVGSPVSFMGSATGGTGSYTYQWDFNYDGSFNTQSTLQNPTYTYTMDDTYTVAFQVNDGTTTDLCTTTATISPYIPTTPPYVQVNPIHQTISPEETFCVDIMVNSDIHTVTTVGFQLTYNGGYFMVDSFTYEDLLGTSVLEMGTPASGDDSGLINYAVSRTDGGADTENGKVATICFTAKPGAPAGTYPLDLSDVILVDGSEAITGVTLVNGEVTLNPCVNDPDVNDDGNVNVLDMILVGQHWGQTGDNGWIPEDINCDGAINIYDMILIGQNWTG